MCLACATSTSPIGATPSWRCCRRNRSCRRRSPPWSTGDRFYHHRRAAALARISYRCSALLVLRPWDLVLCPSLVLGPSSGPRSFVHGTAGATFAADPLTRLSWTRDQGPRTDHGPRTDKAPSPKDEGLRSTFANGCTISQRWAVSNASGSNARIM